MIAGVVTAAAMITIAGLLLTWLWGYRAGLADGGAAHRATHAAAQLDAKDRAWRAAAADRRAHAWPQAAPGATPRHAAPRRRTPTTPNAVLRAADAWTARAAAA